MRLLGWGRARFWILWEGEADAEVLVLGFFLRFVCGILVSARMGWDGENMVGVCRIGAALGLVY